MNELAVVVPCYNEEAVLPEAARRLVSVLQSLAARAKIDPASSIYFVDDGSTDRTWSIISSLVDQGLPVVGVKLSHNRGHQNALLAGLFTARGDAVVSLDADLQDDVDAIERMVDEFQAGAQVVYGVRRGRKSDSLFKRWTARGFYGLLSWMGAETIFDHADYRLLGRRAVEALKEYGEVNLYLRGVVPMLGFRSAVVEYDRAPRHAGQSKYPFSKMLALGIDAITSFSVYPLRLISLLGLMVAAGSAAVAAWALFVTLFTTRTVAGWASTVLPIYFLGGVQLFALGVIGEYVGKIYLESKRRPRFFIEAVKSHPQRSRGPRPALPGGEGPPEELS